MEKLKDIIKRQLEFQRLVDFPIDSILEKDRNELSEKYIFKLIEEAIELRKEFPSVMNPWSKTQKNIDLNRIQEELSDVLLFYINILLTWKIPIENLIEIADKVQQNNFTKIKEKKMKMLNERILDIPGYTSGIGTGNLNPGFIFVGQNPGTTIIHGYKMWNDPTSGSSKILLPILKSIGIHDQCYFTNIVKCITINNDCPTEKETAFWLPFLLEEIEILKTNNLSTKIITMGRYANEVLPHNITIPHPSYILRGGMSKEDYENEIRKNITSSN